MDKTKTIIPASQTSTITRIDTSSWLSWSCYLATFCLAAAFNPETTARLSSNTAVICVLVGSVWLFLACVVMIQNHMRLSVLAHTFGEPKQLVTSGPFRFSRNPIYVAFLGPLAALATISPTAALMGIATYMTMMTLTVIRREENVLAKEFGAAYLAYAADVPRWFAMPFSRLSAGRGASWRQSLFCPRVAATSSSQASAGNWAATDYSERGSAAPSA